MSDDVEIGTLWTKTGAGLDFQLARIEIVEVVTDHEYIDVSITSPMKKNPARTRWSVILARLMLRKPPPKRIVDEARVGRREFVAGLQSPPKIRARIIEWIDRDIHVGDVLRSHTGVELRHLGKPMGMLLITEYSQDFPDDHGPGAKWISGHVMPLDAQDPFEADDDSTQL
jgi:hypothetical protein